MPARLLVLATIGLVVGVLSLVQGLRAVGEPNAVYIAIGCLTLGGVLLIVIGWRRATRK